MIIFSHDHQCSYNTNNSNTYQASLITLKCVKKTKTKPKKNKKKKHTKLGNYTFHTINFSNKDIQISDSLTLI